MVAPQLTVVTNITVQLGIKAERRPHRFSRAQRGGGTGNTSSTVLVTFKSLSGVVCTGLQ
jgi:hypothetical protein